MTQFHFIQNLLQVKDPNIQFQNKSDEVMKNNRKAVLFYGNLDKFPDVCVSCGHVSETSQDMIRNGGFESDVHLGMFNRTPCYLRLRNQRFPLFDWLTHTQGIVDYLLDQSPAFKASYDCIQSACYGTS